MSDNNYDPYEQLANAIVLTAVKDYRGANKKLLRGRKNESARIMLEECLVFFQSEWFKIITDVDSEYLIEKLSKEV